MDETLPTFEEVVELIGSTKPPVACRVVELRGDGTERSAKVLFDGVESWFIEDGARVELRASRDRVLFDEAGELRRVGPGSAFVYSNAWVKTPIEGYLMNLEGATGRVTGRDEVDGRQAVIAEFLGLRVGEDIAFLLHVDLETGIVLRMSRPDLGEVLRIEGLRVGTVEELPR